MSTPPLTAAFPAPTACFAANRARLGGSYPDRHRSVLSLAAHRRAQSIVVSWPGYAPTPLASLSALAADLGVARIDYKDEGDRFGLSSFKALGGAHAVFRLLVGELERRTGRSVDTGALAAGDLAETVADITVTCATDGNHGRSVAWGARMFGARAVIFVHATVSEGRAEAIRRLGAEVVRTAGNYDDSVREADRAAKANGWFVVSDTSYPGYTEVPRDVMQGYSVMVAEAIAECPEPPTHVFVQGGVGGLAAAVTAHLWETLGDRMPFVTVVEPETAACLLESARAGRPTVVGGDLDTIMAGLACGEPSLIAWPILSDGAGAFMAIPDTAAAHAMRLLASGDAGATLVGGESGVAGLAGLLVLAGRPEWRTAIALGAESRVLLFGSEGDSDPDLYAEIVGRTGEAVRAGAAA
jgi:diaminopropionate ammonia-lyase